MHYNALYFFQADLWAGIFIGFQKLRLHGYLRQNLSFVTSCFTTPDERDKNTDDNDKNRCAAYHCGTADQT